MVRERSILYSFVALCVALLMCVHTDGGHASNDIERGLQAVRSGDVERAIQAWTTALRRNPKSYAAYVNRGSAHMQAGYVFKGITDWHKARDFSPTFAYGVYSGGYIRQASGNAAMLNYAASLELDPDHVASVVMMGVTYLDLGRRDMALDLFKKSKDLTKNPLLKNYLEHWGETLEP
ncbi:MAG: tetratricopeptide repeat protein [Desulfomonilaceae bacterium]|nr:tetratricopeptide repeat protein [Desulfomonilaceae bacterium]